MDRLGDVSKLKSTSKPQGLVSKLLSEGNQEAIHFLRHWVSGLMNGLESIDRTARKTILRECGKGCAESYTIEVFRNARAQSADLEHFLGILAAKFPEARYELLTPSTIRVCYTYCACDLVKWGLVKSPLICECSAFNLQENFEQAWGIGAHVTLETSILEGAPECVLVVSLESPPGQVNLSGA